MKAGQGKSTAPISANVNGLSAFRLLVTCWSSYYGAESLLRKAESRAVDLPGPLESQSYGYRYVWRCFSLDIYGQVNRGWRGLWFLFFWIVLHNWGFLLSQIDNQSNDWQKSPVQYWLIQTKAYQSIQKMKVLFNN